MPMVSSGHVSPISGAPGAMLTNVGPERRQSFEPPITPSSPRFRPSSTPRSIAVASVLLSALLRPSAREADAVSNSTESDTMGEMDAAVNAEAFSQSNRAGRRNAMPDLGIDNVDVGAHKLAEAFSNLGASDAAAGASGQAASSSGAAPAKE